MTNYTRGRAFEYAVRDKLIDAGWYCLRAAGSHGVADLWAMKRGVCAWVQCKSGKEASNKEAKALYDLATHYGGVPVLAERTGRKTFWWQIVPAMAGGTEPLTYVPFERDAPLCGGMGGRP